MPRKRRDWVGLTEAEARLLEPGDAIFMVGAPDDIWLVKRVIKMARGVIVVAGKRSDTGSLSEKQFFPYEIERL